jgi:hypothetical protein
LARRRQSARQLAGVRRHDVLPLVMRRFLCRAAVAGALGLGVTGCFGSTESTGKLVCPTSVIAPDLDAAAQLRPGGSGPDDIRFGVKVMSVKTNCRTEKIGLTAEARISFLAARNDPTLKQGEFAYFVAVADAQRNILNKKEYTVSLEFSPRQNRLQVSDQVAVGLPVRDLSSGGKYIIIVGLQLTADQLEFNRKQQQAQ